MDLRSSTSGTSEPTGDDVYWYVLREDGSDVGKSGYLSVLCQASQGRITSCAGTASHKIVRRFRQFPVNFVAHVALVVGELFSRYTVDTVSTVL